ncbi:hypothetical protein QQP08_015970 [Theobroma cacao]|nr:hypothetical protein QQP08_015970 [Theobroma cacao]
MQYVNLVKSHEIETARLTGFCLKLQKRCFPAPPTPERHRRGQSLKCVIKFFKIQRQEVSNISFQQRVPGDDLNN